MDKFLTKHCRFRPVGGVQIAIGSDRDRFKNRILSRIALLANDVLDSVVVIQSHVITRLQIFF